MVGQILGNPWVGAIMKKKAKSTAVAKKAAKKKSSPKGKRSKKEQNPADLRKNISKLVRSHARQMTKAVINVGEQGQLAPVKYLFEMANIYPEPTDGSESTREEDSLAKTLMERLDLPTEPIGRDEEDEVMVIPARAQVEGADEVTESEEVAELSLNS